MSKLSSFNIITYISGREFPSILLHLVVDETNVPLYILKPKHAYPPKRIIEYL